MKSLDTVVRLNGRHGDGEDFTALLYEGRQGVPYEDGPAEQAIPI